MIKLRNLLEKLDYDLLHRDGSVIEDPAEKEAVLDTEAEDITNDSRKVGEKSLFFCIEGAKSDGHAFAGQAAQSGASVLIVQKMPDLSAADESKTPAIVRVADSRYAMAFISAAFYGHPAEKLKMIGITGTKGKTTTTYMVRSILETAGFKVGLIGTIEMAYGDVHIPAGNTTPESIVLQKTLRDMVDAGMEAVVMEVSSQALMLRRTEGFVFDLGIFTNLSPDHIGPAEHKDLADYIHCKGLLFKQCRVGIVNGDDEHLEQVLEGHTCRVQTYGLSEKDDLYADHLELIHKPGELGVRFQTHGLIELKAEVPTPGRFSVYNALCAIAICTHFGVKAEDIQDALLKVHVKGRIEMIKVSNDFTLMIDYAHNAMALESLLTTLREYNPHRLISVFGCGGNRSKLRRYEMGEVSGKLADFTIITSDNPRFEEPMDIIADIVTGISKTDGKHIEIPDRKEAIAYAIHHGEPGDIIVLAGKGHEDYQEIKGKKYPMDERVLIREILDADGVSFD